MQFLKNWWLRPYGSKEVLRVSLPLVLSMMSASIMSFTDRLFLGWYSIESLSASMPAFITIFSFIAFFMGVAEYVSVFVAQYTGSGNARMAGASVWQGLYFSLGAAVILAFLALPGRAIFEAAGHPAGVIELEIIYYHILAVNAGFLIAGVVMSGLYSGQGLTRVVMIVNMVGAGINIPLDYVLINGLQWGDRTIVPELGIAGAGIATAIGWMIMFCLYIFLLFRKSNDREFGLRSQWRFQPKLFFRFLRFGFPSGMQFFLDVLAVTCFTLLVGRLGEIELAATNIVFSLHTLIFLPLVGMHIAVCVLTGQAVGKKEAFHAKTTANSAVILNFMYITVIGSIFLIWPMSLLHLFRTTGMSPEEFAPIAAMGMVLLRFLVFFTLFDGLTMVYLGVLKGAGDVAFIMKAIAVCASCGLALPSYIGITWFNFSIYNAWTVLTCFAVLLATVFRVRYKRGAWMTKSVIV